MNRQSIRTSDRVLLGSIAVGWLFTIYAQNAHVTYLIALLSSLAGVYVWLSLCTAVYVSRTIPWIVVIFTVIAIGLGEILNFYERIEWFDAVLHFTSAIFLGGLSYLILLVYRNARRIRISTRFMFILATSIAVSLAVYWEIFEFTVDTLLDKNMQPSLGDTMHDLMLGSVGSLIGVWTIHWLSRAPNQADKNIVESHVQEIIIKNQKIVQTD